MCDPFGVGKLKQDIRALSEKIESQFGDLRLVSSNNNRTISDCDSRLSEISGRVDILDSFQSHNLAKARKKAEQLFRKAGASMGIIDLHAYSFRGWMDFCRDQKTLANQQRTSIMEENPSHIKQSQDDYEDEEFQRVNESISLLSTRIADLESKVLANNAFLVNAKTHAEELVSSAVREFNLELESVKGTLAQSLNRSVVLDGRLFQEVERMQFLSNHLQDSIDFVSSAAAKSVSWKIDSVAQSLKSRIYSFSSPVFGLGMRLGFQLKLWISSTSSPPIPGQISVSLRVPIGTAVVFQIFVGGRTEKVSFVFSKETSIWASESFISFTKAYHLPTNSIDIKLELVSMKSQLHITSAKSQGQIESSFQTDFEQIELVRKLVHMEIEKFKIDLKREAHWYIPQIREIINKRITMASEDFRVGGVSFKYMELIPCYEDDEFCSIKFVLNNKKEKIRWLKIKVSIGSHSTKVLEWGCSVEASETEILLERTRFCKLEKEIDKIKNSLLIILEILEIEKFPSSLKSVSIATPVQIVRRGVVADPLKIESDSESDRQYLIDHPEFIPPVITACK